MIIINVLLINVKFFQIFNDFNRIYKIYSLKIKNRLGVINVENRELPTTEQLDFLDWEIGAFFHFGIRTFNEGYMDWDGKMMDLKSFNPCELNCENWIVHIKEAGAKYAILTCKHHDGFANWPSKYTDYSVANTPWKDGKGDVVKEFVMACRKYDIKVGLYYSPAEVGFKKHTSEEYEDYFINQISELLENYGVIDYLWFDGCGSEGHEFNKDRIISAIRNLQPHILIFNMWDPNTRWVGNEAGIAGVENCDYVSSLDFSVLTDKKDKLEREKYLPAECDFMIRERNWFYSEYDVHTVKSIEELVGIYYYSVGNGANFLVNIGPDRRGLLPEVDAIRLKEFGERINKLFANPINSTYEMTNTGISIKLEKESLINQVVLKEDISKGGSVDKFKIYIKSRIMSDPKCVYIGEYIGHKRIITFPTIRVTEVLVQVCDSDGKYKLIEPMVYNTN